MFGDGGQTRDFIYVGDVAEANYRALRAPQANNIYNISTETETSVNTLIEIMGNIAHKQMDKTYALPREGDIYRSFLANGAARKDFSWQPQMVLADGLTRTYQYLCNI